MSQAWGYRAIVVFNQGHSVLVYEGFNPDEAKRAGRERVSRDPRVIDRIEIQDREGVIETLWRKEWS